MLLERRLDNVMLRFGFSSSHAEARQLVRHGHFTVNGKRHQHPVVPGSSPAHVHDRGPRAGADKRQKIVVEAALANVDRQGPAAGRG